MAQKCRWFTKDHNLNNVNHDEITLEQALEIVRKYAQRPFKESSPISENEVADHYFGFFREDVPESWMDICVIKGKTGTEPNFLSMYSFPQIYKAQSWLQRIFGSREAIHDETISSIESLEKRVKQFFELSSDAFQEQIRSELE